MRYAETGFELEIDLSRGSIDRVESDPELTRLHLGGLGTSARILCPWQNATTLMNRSGRNYGER